MQSHLQGHLPMSHKNPSFLATLYVEATESSSATCAAPLLMHGFPAEPEHRVTWHNWMRPPFSQWGFRNLARLRPTIDVPTPPGGWPPPWPNVAEIEAVLPHQKWTLIGGLIAQLHGERSSTAQP